MDAEPLPIVSLVSSKSPRDLVWDTLIEFFGVPRMDTERKMFGRVAAELLRGGATQDETAKACKYVQDTFDSPSVNAVPKWFSAAQNVKAQRTPQQAAFDELRGHIT